MSDKILDFMGVQTEEEALKILQAFSEPPISVTLVVDGLGRVLMSASANLPVRMLETILLEGLRIATRGNQEAGREVKREAVDDQSPE